LNGHYGGNSAIFLVGTSELHAIAGCVAYFSPIHFLEKPHACHTAHKRHRYEHEDYTPHVWTDLNRTRNFMILRIIVALLFAALLVWLFVFPYVEH
jgi:hypothetical protein